VPITCGHRIFKFKLNLSDQNAAYVTQTNRQAFCQGLMRRHCGKPRTKSTTTAGEPELIICLHDGCLPKKTCIVQQNKLGPYNYRVSWGIYADRKQMYLALTEFCKQITLHKIQFKTGARDNILGWSTMLHAGRSLVRFVKKSLIFFSMYLLLPAALWP
jgi:hypothetical protein